VHLAYKHFHRFFSPAGHQGTYNVDTFRHTCNKNSKTGENLRTINGNRAQKLGTCVKEDCKFQLCCCAFRIHTSMDFFFSRSRSTYVRIQKSCIVDIFTAKFVNFLFIHKCHERSQRLCTATGFFRFFRLASEESVLQISGIFSFYRNRRLVIWMFTNNTP
jgi:hypothetical protein